MEDLISIIVPVYNIEKYLNRCIKSIVKQTYNNLEIILVNDGSTDTSLSICDEWEHKDKRIKILSQPNRGVSEARMNGLKSANGKYVSFIDGDDYIEEHYFEILHQNIIKYDADMVCCDCLEVVNGEKTDRFHNVINNRLLNSLQEYLQDYFLKNEFYGYVVWGKLIKCDLAQSVYFPNIQFGEDTVYMLSLFEKNPITYIINYQGYYYIRNETSVTKKTTDVIKKNLDTLLIGKILISLSKSCSDEMKKCAYEEYAHRIYAILKFAIKSYDKNEYKKLYHVLFKHIKTVLNFKNLNKKTKIILFIYFKFPCLFLIIGRIYNLLYVR